MLDMTYFFSRILKRRRKKCNKNHRTTPINLTCHILLDQNTTLLDDSGPALLLADHSRCVMMAWARLTSHRGHSRGAHSTLGNTDDLEIHRRVWKQREKNK